MSRESRLVGTVQSATTQEEAWGSGRTGQAGRTEDDLLGRREHVERKGDFVLVILQEQPAEEAGEDGGRRRLRHGGLSRECRVSSVESGRVDKIGEV